MREPLDRRLEPTQRSASDAQRWARDANETQRPAGLHAGLASTRISLSAHLDFAIDLRTFFAESFGRPVARGIFEKAITSSRSNSIADPTRCLGRIRPSPTSWLTREVLTPNRSATSWVVSSVPMDIDMAPIVRQELDFSIKKIGGVANGSLAAPPGLHRPRRFSFSHFAARLLWRRHQLVDRFHWPIARST